MRLIQIITISAILFSSCGSEKEEAQTSSSETEIISQSMMSIDSASTVFIQAIEDRDTDMAIHMMHPGLKEMVPAAQLKKSIEAMYSNPDIQIEIVNGSVDSITEGQQIDDVDYHVVFYSFDMLTSMPKADMPLLEQMEATYVLQFGEDNVAFDVSKKMFNIRMNSIMFGVLAPSYDNWKFLEYRPERAEVLNALIPVEVYSQI